MYYHISGIVSELEPYIAVIDCGGVGYLLNVSLNTLACLKVGERARLYVSESIREVSFELYGFFGKSEKKCFDMLVGVSGVGPKAALSILSSSTPEALAWGPTAPIRRASSLVSTPTPLVRRAMVLSVVAISAMRSSTDLSLSPAESISFLSSSLMSRRAPPTVTMA